MSRVIALNTEAELRVNWRSARLRMMLLLLRSTFLGLSGALSPMPPFRVNDTVLIRRIYIRTRARARMRLRISAKASSSEYRKSIRARLANWTRNIEIPVCARREF